MGVYAFLRKLYNECTLKLGIAQDFKVSFLSCKHTHKNNSCPRFLHLSKGTQGAATPSPSLIDLHIKRSNKPKKYQDLELPLSGEEASLGRVRGGVRLR